ncbi:MAG: glycosyl transferase family 1 [Planctomycetota bacterium]|nr:MAG: glycosyl transferase family 1 [Planctomycetota bacterium]
MKILLEGHRLARVSNFGGIDSYWHKLVPELLARHPVEQDFSLFSAFLNPKHGRGLSAYRKRGARVHHWWASPEWLDASARFGGQVEWYCGKQDIVHVPEPLWKLSTRGRLVVTAHDLMYLHHPQYLDPRWVARLQEGTERLASKAAYWVCVSEHTQRDLVKNYGVPLGRTEVIYHGIEERFRSVNDQPEQIQRVREQFSLAARPYFLFLGSVEPKKNLPMLLEAYAKALDKGLQADLAVAGRAGWKAEAVRAVAGANPKLQERVKFLGFIDQEDLAPLTAGAQAMVLPSRYEGFGMPVIEAMAAATVVLCSDRGALPEVAGGAAELFDADDVDGLAELLLRVDQDSTFCENLTAKGLQHSASFSWSKCAEQHCAAYSKAMSLPR